MSGSVVYDGVTRPIDDDDDDDDKGSVGAPRLFSGQKLWFSHAVPQRPWLMQNAKINGAIIVDMDKDADIKLVDHTRKNNAPGTHSYRYVELSIRNGLLENLASHEVGVMSRVARPVGSTMTAPKSGRIPFTEEDEQFLWNWVKPYDEMGGKWKGNEIYKQLEEVNPRHTFQSWRDRWMKYTRFQKREVTATVGLETPAAEPSGPAHPEVRSAESSHPRKRRRETNDDGEVERTAHSKDQHASRPDRTQISAERSPDPVHEREQEPGEEAERPSNLLPVARKPFDKNEFKQLYHLIPKLTETTPEDFDRAWADIGESEDLGGHTAEEWKHYFESRVVPFYCRRNGLQIVQVAPYLFRGRRNTNDTASSENDDGREEEKDYTGESFSEGEDKDKEDYADEEREKEADTGAKTDDNEEIQNPPSSPRKLECSQCYTRETNEWRSDKKGKPLCYGCAGILRPRGVPRPSTAWVEANHEIPERAILSQLRTPFAPVASGRSEAHTRFSATSNPSYVSRAVQTSFPTEDPIPLRPASLESPQVSRQSRSPSFQPESPTLSRLPEPNEARKRSAGRGTQSQSTQDSNKSATQSQIQGHITASQDFSATMGETQSKESDTQQGNPESQPQNTSAPSFEISTKGARKRLQDEPGNLEIQQDSSLSTDRGPPREPPALRMTDSDDDDDLVPIHSAPLPSAPKRLLRSRRVPPPFGSERDEEEDEEDEEEVETRVIQGPRLEEGVQVTSPMSVHLLSKGQQWENHAPDPTSAYADSEIGSEEIEGLEDIEPLQKGRSDTTTERYETAHESEQDWETALEDQRRPFRKRRLSTQALFNRRLDIIETMDWTLELPEPEGGWDGALSANQDHGGDPNLNPTGSDSADQGRPSPEISIKLERKDEDTSYLDSLPLPPSPNAEGNRDGAEEADPSPEHDGHETDTWLADQKAIHKTIPALHLEPILFKAVEVTSFDFELASQVVGIMLEKSDALARELRNQKHPRRSSGRTSSAISVTEVLGGIPVDTLVPKDIRGVWTEEDDKLLISKDARRVNKALDKHGHDGCQARFEFLQQFAQE